MNKGSGIKSWAHGATSNSEMWTPNSKERDACSVSFPNTERVEINSPWERFLCFSQDGSWLASFDRPAPNLLSWFGTRLGKNTNYISHSWTFKARLLQLYTRACTAFFSTMRLRVLEWFVLICSTGRHRRYPNFLLNASKSFVYLIIELHRRTDLHTTFASITRSTSYPILFSFHFSFSFRKRSWKYFLRDLFEC